MGMASLQTLLDGIKPAVITDGDEEASSTNTTVLDEVIAHIDEKTVIDISIQSPTKNPMETHGQ